MHVPVYRQGMVVFYEILWGTLTRGVLRSTLVNERGPDAYKILYFPPGDGLSSLKILSEVIKQHYLGFLEFHSAERTA